MEVLFFLQEQRNSAVYQQQCHHRIQDLLIILEEFLEDGAEQHPADIGKQYHEPVGDQHHGKHADGTVIGKYKVCDKGHAVQKALGIDELQNHPRMHGCGIQMQFFLLFFFFRLRFISPDDPRQPEDIQRTDGRHHLQDHGDIGIDEKIAGNGDQQNQRKACGHAEAETQALSEAVIGAVCHAHQVIRPRGDAGNEHIRNKCEPIEHISSPL